MMKIRFLMFRRAGSVSLLAVVLASCAQVTQYQPPVDGPLAEFEFLDNSGRTFALVTKDENDCMNYDYYGRNNINTTGTWSVMAGADNPFIFSYRISGATSVCRIIARFLPESGKKYVVYGDTGFSAKDNPSFFEKLFGNDVQGFCTMGVAEVVGEQYKPVAIEKVEPERQFVASKMLVPDNESYSAGWCNAFPE